MNMFTRVTLLIILAATLLSGCGINVRRESPVEATSPIEHLPPANYSPLVSEAVYAAPETAVAFKRLVPKYLAWYAASEKGKAPRECFTIPKLDAVDTVTGLNFGPFARDVNVCLNVDNPLHPKRQPLAYEANFPPVGNYHLGKATCGTVFAEFWGVYTLTQNELNVRVERIRAQHGQGKWSNWRDALWGNFLRFNKPGRFDRRDDSFLCVSGDPPVRENVPPVDYRIEYNQRHFLLHDPALEATARAAATASISGECNGQQECARDGLTAFNAPITNCLIEGLCGTPYNGPPFVHRCNAVAPEASRLPQDADPTKCRKVYCLSMSRGLKLMDYRGPNASRTNMDGNVLLVCEGHPLEPSKL